MGLRPLAICMSTLPSFVLAVYGFVLQYVNNSRKLGGFFAHKLQLVSSVVGANSNL